MAETARMTVDFRTEPARYRHWKLALDGRVATLAMDVREDGGLVPGYELKLNSYDLGVDIELYDAVQRLRFEHPEVRAVVVTSGKGKVFCAGANIRMLAASGHPWKVYFCKSTTETRNGMEDASADAVPPLDRALWHRHPRRHRRVVFVEALPTTATGKVRRVELRAMAAGLLSEPIQGGAAQ